MTTPTTPDVRAEPFKALREATAAVLTPIGNMTDRQTAVLRTMERRLAFQQACSPHTIDTLLVRLSDAESALKARDAEIERLRGDAERYRTLRRKVCIVGSNFHIVNLAPTYVAPDAAVELDAAIDQARATGGEGKS